MGYSYLTNSQKTNWNNEFNNIHATFARPIAIYKTAKQIVINPNPDNNIFFQNAPFNSEVETIQQSGIFQARIKYGTRENLTPFNSIQYRGASEQNMIRLEEGEVRLKLDPTGAAFLAGAKRVTFDGTIFDVVTSKRPHGLFDPNFETFYLKKLN
jgi:hypothetical protein